MIDLRQFEGFINTPPLWMNTQFEITQFILPEIHLNQVNPKPFSNRIRLGHQMEHVFKQLITQDQTYKVLLFNLAIKNETRTIGEIDFILENSVTKEIIHVELTYKFYLIDTSISDPIHQLIGPNRKDLFFTKMQKIKNQQFQLLHASEGIKALKLKRIDHEIIKHQACYKAQLFVPYQTKKIDITPLNNDCIIGFWIPFNDFNTIEFSSFQYYMPYKSEWVMAPNNDIAWKSHQEIMLEIKLKMSAEIAPMIWIKKSETDFEKCFVVWW